MKTAFKKQVSMQTFKQTHNVVGLVKLFRNPHTDKWFAAYETADGENTLPASKRFDEDTYMQLAKERGLQCVMPQDSDTFIVCAKGGGLTAALEV